jgi:hypothetical protein
MALGKEQAKNRPALGRVKSSPQSFCSTDLFAAYGSMKLISLGREVRISFCVGGITLP